MRIVQITEKKAEKMAELAETMLQAGGKLMTCIEELREGEWSEEDDHEYGMRRGMRNEHDYYPEEEREMCRDRERDGMRRGSMGSGRYSRY